MTDNPRQGRRELAACPQLLRVARNDCKTVIVNTTAPRSHMPRSTAKRAIPCPGVCETRSTLLWHCVTQPWSSTRICRLIGLWTMLYAAYTFKQVMMQVKATESTIISTRTILRDFLRRKRPSNTVDLLKLESRLQGVRA
jgi:hypothetical protein